MRMRINKGNFPLCDFIIARLFVGIVWYVRACLYIKYYNRATIASHLGILQKQYTKKWNRDRIDEDVKM